MEKFKAWEMKRNAFSRQGLTAATKLDPKAQEKIEVTAWIQSQVEELQTQIEQSEAEIETLQGGGKKRGKSGGAAAERLEELEHLNERRKWHVNRLELIMRFLDNGSLAVDKVRDIQENVAYFVESNMVCMLFVCLVCDLISVFRTITSRGMRVSTMSSISMRKRKSLALLKRKPNHQTQRTRVKVEPVLDQLYTSSLRLFTANLPAQTPLHWKSEDDSVANKRDGSPALEKAPVTTQRSELTSFSDFNAG